MANMTNLYDSSICTACRACQVACKNWNQLPASIKPFKGNYQTHEDTDGDTFTIVLMNEVDNAAHGVDWNFAKFQCMHCFDAACMKACPRGAYTKTEWGATIHDPDKCIGCQYCTYACPFGVPKHRKREDKITKCTLCADRVTEGLAPACATTCAPGALKFGDRDELIEYARERLNTCKPTAIPMPPSMASMNCGLNKLYILTDTPDKFGLWSIPRPMGPSLLAGLGRRYFAGNPRSPGSFALSFVTTRLIQQTPRTP